MSVAAQPTVLNRSAINNAEEARAAGLLVRAAFREELRDRVAALGLERNVAELDMLGYTIIENAAPLAFFDELRERIVRLSDERRKQGVWGDKRGVFSDTILNCVGKGRVFEDAVLNPKLNTLAACLLGDGYLINATNAVIVEQGAPSLPIHSDNAYVPEPFPTWPVTFTSVWFTEDLDAERGASRVIPGSHHHARNPTSGEGEDAAIAIDCPKGSVVVWNGATWHGNCGRNAPGERVTFHTSFCRMHMQPFANNDAVPQEVVDLRPELAQLLGRGLPHRREGDEGPNPELRANAIRLWSRQL